MNRLLWLGGLTLLAMIVGTAAFVYDVKYQTGRLNRQVADLTRQIEREREMIATLRAETSALENPARVQALATRHLQHLRPFNVQQLALAHELPDRPMDLGLFIESLGAGRLNQMGREAGSPTGATRTPIAAPVPMSRPPPPQPPRR